MFSETTAVIVATAAMFIATTSAYISIQQAELLTVQSSERLNSLAQTIFRLEEQVLLAEKDRNRSEFLLEVIRSSNADIEQLLIEQDRAIDQLTSRNIFLSMEIATNKDELERLIVEQDDAIRQLEAEMARFEAEIRRSDAVVEPVTPEEFEQ